jgi:hypothetical protein
MIIFWIVADKVAFVKHFLWLIGQHPESSRLWDDLIDARKGPLVTPGASLT